MTKTNSVNVTPEIEAVAKAIYYTHPSYKDNTIIPTEKGPKLMLGEVVKWEDLGTDLLKEYRITECYEAAFAAVKAMGREKGKNV